MALNANTIVQAPKVEQPAKAATPPKDKKALNAGSIVVKNKRPLKPKYVTPEAGALTPVKKKLDRRPSKYIIDMMTP
jgi:hypothetical protein